MNVPWETEMRKSLISLGGSVFRCPVISEQAEGVEELLLGPGPSLHICQLL